MRRWSRICVTVAVWSSLTFLVHAADEPTTTTKGSLHLSVVDSAGHKVAGAEIYVSIWTNEKGFKANRDYVCDENGQVEIRLPGKLEILRVWAKGPGYAPMFGQLWPQSGSESPPLPEKFTFVLTPGTTIGGIVQNEDGEPIPGARVEVVYLRGGEDFKAPKPTTYNHWLAEDKTALITDAQGSWSLGNVPPGSGVRLQFRLSHPDYINQSIGLREEPSITIEQLRNQSAKFAMNRGYVVTGNVTDPEGKPIKDAVIIWGDQPYWEDGSQEVRTDRDGNYRLVPLARGPMRITVVARGWMPQMKRVEIEPGMQAVDFKLQPGKKLRVKLVDAAGANRRDRAFPGKGPRAAKYGPRRGKMNVWNNSTRSTD